MNPTVGVVAAKAQPVLTAPRKKSRLSMCMVVRSCENGYPLEEIFFSGGNRVKTEKNPF